jgi:hypothetical protein
LRESGRHSLHRFLAATEPVRGRMGYRLSCAIVYRGAESAGHDDHVRSLYGCVNNRDDVLPFIANDRFESNGDPKFSEFISEEERVGVGSAPDQQFSTDGDGFCGKLVHLVYLVCLVYWFVWFFWLNETN